MCKIKFQVSQSIIRYRAFNVLEASNKLLCEGFEIYSFSSEIIKTDSVSWRWPSTIFTEMVKWSGLEVLNSGGISGACVLESDRNTESNPQCGVADVLIWDQSAGSDSLNPPQSSRYAKQAMNDCKSWYSGSEVHSLPLQWICASAAEPVIIRTFTDSLFCRSVSWVNLLKKILIIIYKITECYSIKIFLFNLGGKMWCESPKCSN